MKHDWVIQTSLAEHRDHVVVRAEICRMLDGSMVLVDDLLITFNQALVISVDVARTDKQLDKLLNTNEKN